jgi:hypothetical protein
MKKLHLNPIQARLFEKLFSNYFGRLEGSLKYATRPGPEKYMGAWGHCSQEGSLLPGR